ncbi:MAG TPA: hypothetical protein VJO13_10865 [Ktedonobacterales bacterium]|nr:hypothetical protein [Ktedonobacterales bacterium]
MQLTAANSVREHEKPMSWARAIVMAVGFFFLTAILLGQIPSFVFVVSTLSTLTRMEQSFLAMGLLALGIGMICFTVSFLYDVKPVLPWPLFFVGGAALAVIGLFMLYQVRVGIHTSGFFGTGWSEYLPDKFVDVKTGTVTYWPSDNPGYLFHPAWFQPQSIDLSAIGIIALLTGLGVASVAALNPLVLSGRLLGPMRDLLVRLSIGLAIVIAALWLTINTFANIVPDDGDHAGILNIMLFIGLILALFGLEVWLLPVLTANRQQFMPGVYLHGVVGFIGMVAVPLLIIWVILYPVVNLIHNLDSTQFFVQCSQKTEIPTSCTFTPFSGYIICAIVFTNLFAILFAGLYFWSTRRNTVVLGSTLALIFVAIAPLVIHLDLFTQIPIGILLALGIVVLTFVYTWATQREFAPTAPQQLGCAGQWLVLGTLLLFLMMGFAFFSLPLYYELESGLMFFYQPGAGGLHDAWWMLLLMGGLGLYQLVVLMRRRYHPMGNWRKFGLWVNAIALALMVTAGINGFQADVLQKGIDAMDGSHAMFVTAICFAIVGIAACAIAAVRTRSIPWLVAILVSVLIGLALAFVAYNLDKPYPELVIFGFALTMLGAFAYTAAGPDPEDVYLNGYETTEGVVPAATRP